MQFGSNNGLFFSLSLFFPILHCNDWKSSILLVVAVQSHSITWEGLTSGTTSQTWDSVFKWPHQCVLTQAVPCLLVCGQSGGFSTPWPCLWKGPKGAFITPHDLYQGKMCLYSILYWFINLYSADSSRENNISKIRLWLTSIGLIVIIKKK